MSQPKATSSGLAVVILCGVTFAFYHGLWLPGLVLIKRDAFLFHVPIKQYLSERLSAGELPQWFPYEALGRPFIGTAHTGTFHPFTALYFFLPAADAYRISTLVSCLLASLGVFMLSRTLAFSRAGALVASLAFALSGYVVSLTDHIVYLYSICVLPFFCAALEKALVGSRAWTVVSAVVWATVFLQGDIQTGYYYGFIAVAWTAARATHPYREVGLRLALTGALAALLAGVQLGPAWSAFASSDRAQPVLFQEQAVVWSTHPLRLVNMLASPIAEGRDVVFIARDFFGVTGQFGFWAESLYLGIPVVGLALIGLWQRRDLRILAMLACIALLLALGKYGGLYEIFYHVVPLWSAFRYPEKLMGMVSFATAMLAGAGVDSLRAGHVRPTPWLAGALVCAGAGLGLHTETASVWIAASFGTSSALAHEVTESAALAFPFSAAAALGVGLIVAGIQRRTLHSELLLAVLVVIVTLDLARANLGAYRTGPAEAATFIPPFVEAIAAREGPLHPGRFRLVSLDYTNVAAPADVIRWLGGDVAASVGRRHALGLEHNVQFRIEVAQRYLPSLNASFAAMLDKKIGLRAAARYNVAYYIGRRSHMNDPRLAQVIVAELPAYDLVLFTNPFPAKPRAYLSRRPEHATPPVDSAALIARPDFLDGHVDVIEAPATTLPGPAPDGAAVIERYAPEEVRVQTETPQPAVLILLDAFEKGWTAKLENGLELPILRANALVRAVVVPAGSHLVTFRYQTPLLLAGAVVSLLGCAVCVAMLVHARREQRSQASRP